jgi:hypothetical protein
MCCEQQEEKKMAKQTIVIGLLLSARNTHP